MTISTVDGAVAGRRPTESIFKVGVAMEAAGVFHSHWYSAGRPGAGAAPSSGVNGGSHSSTSALVAGQIPHTDAAGGLNSYLSRLALTATQPCTLWLCDRLWTNSGLSTTLTTSQSITPAALPSRDKNGSTNGEDVLAALEWSAAGGAGTPTETLTYTDQDGNAGATTTLTAVTTPNLGTFEVFPLAAGDTGIRAPTAFQHSATRTSGTFHLVLFRILAQIEITAANVGGTPLDPISGGLPELFDGVVPFLVQLPSSTTATNLAGTYQETHG